MIHVVLPAFNEAHTIGPTIRGIAEIAATATDPYHVVLVDDGSDDATVSIAGAAAAMHPAIALTVLRHPVNRGLGGALRTGLYWAVEHGIEGDVVVTMDADATHPPELIPPMVAKLAEGLDVVVASRYLPRSIVRGVPLFRRLLSDAGRICFRLAFPIAGVRDYTSGYRAYGLAVLRRARAVYGDQLCTQRGFEATVDLLLRLREVGLHASEVPLELDYSGRVGLSKMRVWKTVRASLWLLARRFVERHTRYSSTNVRARLAAQADGP
jgi:dolichol-phosphate mannosyltransferase